MSKLRSLPNRIIAIMTAILVLLSMFSFTLVFGEERDIKTSSLSASDPADFVFVIDSTGSMGSYISAVRNNLSAFMDYLEDKGIDINIAVIDFKDITSDGNDSTTVHKIGDAEWSSNYREIKKELNIISVDGGGDGPETPTNAFNKTFNLEWREDSQKFIFLLTDAGFKDSSDNEELPRMDACISVFRQNDVHVSVVSQPEYEDQYNELYSLTGGKFIDINGSDYYKIMIETAEWVYDALVDSDGDGIPDEWEINGVDTDGNGKVDLHLEKMGCDPDKMDIFVEVDWMYRPREEGKLGWITYTKKEEINLHPSESAMKKVYDAFNKYSWHGKKIQLHIDAGPDSTDYVTGKKWGDLSKGGAIPYSDNFNTGTRYENWNRMAVNNFDRSRWSVFRYCMIVNKYNNSDSSGLAENIPGQFFIVADTDKGNGVTASNQQLAGTFMHELGHTLGLKHGSTDHTNYKPNDLSIMNYLFQFTGLCGTNELTYSNYDLPMLDEEHINENDGIDPDGVITEEKLGTKWYYQKWFIPFKLEGSEEGVAGSSIDFNKNGEIENDVEVNLNKKDETILMGSLEEWNCLMFKGGLIGGYGEDVTVDTVLIEHDDSLDDELKELDYSEAIEENLVGNPDSCGIESVNPHRLYTNISGQTIYVTIANLSSTETQPTLKISSELFDEPLMLDVTIEGQIGEITTKMIEIPVTKSLTAGVYSVICELQNLSGSTEYYNASIEVIDAEEIELNVGDSKNLLPDTTLSYTWRSSDECVDVDTNGVVLAKSEGTATLTGTNGSGDVISCIIKTNKATKSDDDKKSDDSHSDVTHTRIVKRNPADGNWYLYVDDIIDTTYTGIAPNQYGWWRIVNGKVDFNATGIFKNEYGWWRVENGKVNFKANGVYRNQYGWWKTTGGKVTFKETGIFKNQYGWWRVEDSKVNFKANGIYKNQYGWWKTTDGKVTFKETGIFKNEYGWWRVKDSKVDFKAQGIYQNQYGWWKTTNGKVTFKENGVFQNEYGWWKVKDSKVDFNFTGIASNKYGKWYIKNGKVDFSKNGKVIFNNRTYIIKTGKVQE